MSNVKISELAAVEALTAAAVLPVVQGGASHKASVSDILALRGVAVEDFGAVGDGVTSDQDAVDAALATGAKTIFTRPGQRHKVTTFGNAGGAEFENHAHVVKAVTGGLQKLNSYADQAKVVAGSEYLAAFHKLLIAQAATPTRKPIVVFSGDSTTAGDGASADYYLNVLFEQYAKSLGLQTAYGITCTNRGQSGANTEQWRTTYLSGDLAANPDLLVLRWGINDPGWLKDGNAAPLDAGQDYANRRDAESFKTSLRSGLATIRASRSVSSLSIVLMMPNSTSDTPNGRDEMWYETIMPIVRQAARDYQCVFIDTYAFLQDSRHAAGVWMDNPFSDGRAIHPANVMNLWIIGLLGSVVFPTGLRSKLSRTTFTSIGGAENLGDPAALPSTYPYGMTISRAYSGFPVEGNLLTFRSVDETVFQILYPIKDADRTGYSFRFGRSAVLYSQAATWSGWFGGRGDAASVTPLAGYSIPSAGQARAVKVGDQIVCEGYITKTSSAAVAANTNIATLPAGFRPIAEAVYWNAVIWNGSTFGSVVMRVQPDGNIAFAVASPINMSRVWLNVAFSTLA